MVIRLLTCAFLLAAVGCAAATQQQLLKRAAFDLDCPEDQLQTVEIDERTQGVKGCNRRAAYIEDCEVGASQHGTYKKNCTWVMNTNASTD